LRDAIVKQAGKLERFAHDVISCQVVVERGARRHQHGNPYKVHARLVLPDREFEAGFAVREDHRGDDPFAAVTETFEALRRQVVDHRAEQRPAP